MAADTFVTMASRWETQQNRMKQSDIKEHLAKAAVLCGSRPPQMTPGGFINDPANVRVGAATSI